MRKPLLLLGGSFVLATAIVAVAIAGFVGQGTPNAVDHSVSNSQEVLAAVDSHDLTITNQIIAMSDNQNGTLTIQYEYVIQNLSNYLVYDVLATSRFNHNTPGLYTIAVLTGDSGLNLNPNYNGTTDINLLTGANSLAAHTTKVVRLTIVLKYTPALDPFINYVDISGQTDGAAGSASATSSSSQSVSSTTSTPTSSVASSSVAPPVTSTTPSSSSSTVPVSSSSSVASSVSSSVSGQVLGLFASAQVTFNFPSQGLPVVSGGKGL